MRLGLGAELRIPEYGCEFRVIIKEVRACVNTSLPAGFGEVQNSLLE